MAKQLAAPIRQRFYDANGNVLAAGKLYSYQGGSARAYKKNTYKPDQTLNTNPVVLDASGEADVWVEGGPYLFVLCDKDGNEIWARDNINNITGVGIDGANGVNGGTASNATVGLFTGCTGQDLTAGGTKPAPDYILTSGYRTVGKGSAVYIKDATVDAAFVTAHPGWSFRDSQGNGYRISDRQQLWFCAFSAYGDAATDDYPAWLIAKDFLQFYRTTHGNAYYKSVPPLYFERFQFRLSHYLDLTEGVYTLKGEGPSAVDRGGNTQFLMDPGNTGVILQSWATTGINGAVANTAKGSAYSLIEDITVYGQGGTVGADEHGFLIKAPCTLNRCGAYEMGGYGFFVAADVTYAGNANCGKMYGCFANRCGRSGLKFVGGDSNAWEIFGFNAFNCREFGIEDTSFLGCHILGGHTATNGTSASGPTWAPGATRATAQVNYSGHYYRVRPGQATWCSTNAPSGTTAHNTGWFYTGDGAATATYPAWVNGIACVFGGAALVSGASTKSYVGPMYMESDQSPGYNASAKSVIVAGGFSGWHNDPGLGNVIGANDGRIVIPLLGTGGNNGDGIELLPDAIQIGPQCYFQRTSTESFDLRGTLNTTISMTRKGSGDQHAFSMAFPAGTILGTTNGGYTGVATAMPTTGTYTQGAWIRNLTPVVAAGKVLLGWLRLTTGSAHVANTDWTPVYGTTT